VTRADYRGGYQYPPDEPVEIGVWTVGQGGVRTGNLFHADDPLILARLRFCSDSFSGPMDVDWTLRDTFGGILEQGALSGIRVEDGSAEATLVVRGSPGSASSTHPLGWVGSGTVVAGAPSTAGAIDRLQGRKGVFKLEFSTRDRSGSPLGGEELILCAIEPDASGWDPGSPFGTTVHFQSESTSGGFNTSYPHDHVVISSLPQDYVMGAMRDAGFKWVRDFSFASWAAIEPSAGQRSFNDHTLDRCEAFGLQLFPILGWICPDWASTGVLGDPMVTWQQPRFLVNPVAWEAFVHDIVDRYKHRIGIWEIYNEPFFYYSPLEYRETFLIPARVAVSQIQGATPELAGPAGGIWWGTLDHFSQGNFIDQLIQDLAGGLLLDYLTEHFYVKKEPPFEQGHYKIAPLSLKDRVQYYVDSYVGSNQPWTNDVAAVWDGESGQVMPTLRSDTRVHQIDYRGGSPWPRRFLDDMSGNFELSNLISAYLVRAYVVELARGAERFFQHTFFWADTPASAGGQRMLEYDGTPNHGYASLSAMMRRLAGSDYTSAHRI